MGEQQKRVKKKQGKEDVEQRSMFSAKNVDRGREKDKFGAGMMVVGGWHGEGEVKDDDATEK